MFCCVLGLWWRRPGVPFSGAVDQVVACAERAGSPEEEAHVPVTSTGSRSEQRWPQTRRSWPSGTCGRQEGDGTYSKCCVLEEISENLVRSGPGSSAMLLHLTLRSDDSFSPRRKFSNNLLFNTLPDYREPTVYERDENCKAVSTQRLQSPAGGQAHIHFLS